MLSFFAGVTVVALLHAANNAAGLDYKKKSISFAAAGFRPFRHSLTYMRIETLDTVLFKQKQFLRVSDKDTSTQHVFEIDTERNVPVIYDRLTGAVYVVYSQCNKKTVTIIEAFSEPKNENFVVRNALSCTSWSTVESGPNGTITFKIYDPDYGIQNITHNRGDFITIDSDSFGNRVFRVFYNSEAYFFPIYKHIKNGLPIIFNELTGDVLLIDSNQKLYNLEYDEDCYRAVDVKSGIRTYVGVNSQGEVIFDYEPCNPPVPILTKIQTTFCKSLSHDTIKRTFHLSIEVINQKSFVRSDDPVLHVTFHTPIELLDNIPVVHDFITTFTYFVNKKLMDQLFKDGDKFVVRDATSKTGFSLVTPKGNGDVVLTPYTRTAKLVNVTRTIDGHIHRDTNINPMMTLQYSGEKRNLSRVTTDIMVVYDYKDGFPMIYDRLTCEAMLVNVLDVFTYRLLRISPKPSLPSIQLLMCREPLA